MRRYNHGENNIKKAENVPFGFGDPTKGMTRIWGHFVILVGCELVTFRPQIMLNKQNLLRPTKKSIWVTQLHTLPISIAQTSLIYKYPILLESVHY